MPRPEHPGVPLPASSISRLVAEQRIYDEDPERYEARQRMAEQEAEDRARYEAECEAHYRTQMMQEQDDESGELPF